MCSILCTLGGMLEMNMSLRKTISITIALLLLLSVNVIPALAVSVVFDNGSLRFYPEDTPGTSVNSEGQLLQPWYLDSDTEEWYKLTYSDYPLSYAIGVSGDGASFWNANGLIQSNTTFGDFELDSSQYISTGMNTGYGILKATGTVNADVYDLEIENKYTLAQSGYSIRVDTKITNISDATTATNLRYWTGPGDDYMVEDDSPDKYRGNLIGGEFVKISQASEYSDAVWVQSGNSSIVFYTTAGNATTFIYDDYDSGFQEQPEVDPFSTPIEYLDDDGSYGLYVRLGDLEPGESESFTWYYSAGDLAVVGEELDDLGGSTPKGSGGGMPPVNPSDLPDQDAIRSQSAYLSGYPDGTFRPEGAISRAEIAAIIAKLHKASALADAGSSGYSDVAPEFWAAEHIRKAQAGGLLSGYPDGAFRPQGEITRAEFAAIAYKWMARETRNIATLGDVSGHWAEEAISHVVGEGIMTAHEGGVFHPDKALTRAEAVVGINRLVGRLVNANQAGQTFQDVSRWHWAYYEIESAVRNMMD